MNPVVAQAVDLGPGVFGAGVVFGLVALDLALATSAAAVGPRVVSAVTDWRPPQRWQEMRDRYAPRPLDAFLLAAWTAVLVELLRSRPTVAAGVAAFSLLITVLGSLVFWAFESRNRADSRM
ncbi:hypothetical protein [Halomarina oriensis]|uniref:Uncharacterized protein n=1 Tax=Halomarina oriensis TaxID=671145 RepID=A0A6B0GKD0_9EURY|nr:hypothetical protein [Halomarina oriensis]MWG35312.1 hypothetical protein [Halomarina oriensis]